MTVAAIDARQSNQEKHTTREGLPITRLRSRIAGKGKAPAPASTSVVREGNAEGGTSKP